MPWAAVVDGSTSWPTANDHFEAYWFPHTDRMLTKRNNRTAERREPLSRAAGLRRRRAAGQPALRRRQPGRRPPPAPIPPAQPAVLAGAVGAHLQRRLRTGCSPRRAGWCSGRWSTPCRARPACRRCARSARWSSGAAGGSASRSRSGTPRPTTPGCRPRTAATRSTSPSTSTRAPTTRAYFARRRGRCCGPTTAGRTGASCTPGPPPTSRRPTRASRTSSRCATGSTRTGCSPTPTSTGSLGRP